MPAVFACYRRQKSSIKLLQKSEKMKKKCKLLYDLISEIIQKIAVCTKNSGYEQKIGKLYQHCEKVIHNWILENGIKSSYTRSYSRYPQKWG